MFSVRTQLDWVGSPAMARAWAPGCGVSPWNIKRHDGGTAQPNPARPAEESSP